MQSDLIRKKELAPGVWELSFGRTNSGFSFQAGQYIRLVLPKMDAGDTRGPARLFSITSSPAETRAIAIAFRASESGYKKTLLALPNGADVEIEGPFGSFVLPADKKTPIVFIAGGTGITPFVSMLRYAAEQKLKHPFTLLYASRNKNDFPYLSELKALAKNRVLNLKIVCATGLLKKQLIRKNLPKNAGALFYVSGPPSMTDTARSALREGGIAGENIYFEDWNGSDFFAPLCPMTRQMLDMHTDGFFLTDLSGIIQYANPAWEKLSGYSSQEVVGQHTPRILKSGKQNRDYYQEVWKCHLAGKAFRKDVIDRRKDGTLYEFDHLYLPIFSEARQIVGFAAFQRNVSEEKAKRYEEARAILAGLDAGVAVISPDGTIATANKPFKDLFGADGGIGRHYSEVCRMQENGALAPLEETPIERALASGKQTSSDRYSCVTRDNKKIPVAITASPIVKTGEISGVIAVFHDITREKEIEKVRRDFLALASHQLRTPLSGTKWLIETMRRGILGAISKEQKEYMDQLYGINERMIRLVSDMLNVLRLESGAIAMKKEKIGARKLYQTICGVLESATKETAITLKNNLQEKPDITFEGDSALVQTILESFVSNAINYSPAGATVTLDAAEERGEVAFSVADQGIGIPQEEQARIFERFYRASNAKEFKPNGTGLGLYIAAMLADKMGAAISFKSEAGKGTIFYLRIPK